MQCWRRARNVDVLVALRVPPVAAVAVAVASAVEVAVAVAEAPENVPYTAYLLVHEALRYAYLLVYEAVRLVAVAVW